ncbi:MAG TPA: TRAP transporter small permease subunit [Caldilineaceae bacterium]|nr:TRAP transporter small permease subunit [Caldilineaceae bacterium]
MRILLRFAHGVDRLTERLGDLSTVLVLVTIAVGFYNVAVRYMGRFIGVQLSSNLYIELQWYLYSLVFFLGFPYILKHDVNVRVDFLYARWSPRTRAWVDLLGTLLSLIPFCILGIYVTFGPVLASWGRLPNGGWGAWEVSPDPDGLPRAPLKSMIIVAFAALLLQALAQLVKYIAVIRGSTQVVQELQAEAEGQGPVG